MVTGIIPKLPMRDKLKTSNFYIKQLGFKKYGNAEFPHYLMLERDNFQIHFFEFIDLNPLENYSQIYIRLNNIEQIYHQFQNNNVNIHPNGKLEIKPWEQWEFSILDPDHNLLTFGESI